MCLLLLAFAPPACAQAAPYFTLSTQKTFAPSEKPKLHLYTRNVPELEFRIYKVHDEEKFIGGLSELHSFGEQPQTETEDIDEKTWLERFHDWKDGLRHSVRNFFREQLSSDTRQALRDKQYAAAQRSRVVNSAQFALVPLLNSKQLVARWRQQMPPTFVTDNQVVPTDALPAGMYLVEATDGRLKAYTLLMVSQTALITRTVAGQILAFVVDRNTGVPVANAQVALAIGNKPATHLKTDADGVAVFTAAAKPDTVAEKQAQAEDTNEKQWVLARSGDNISLVAPWYSAFNRDAGAQITAYTYTDRPVYRPGHTVHFKSVLRARSGNTLTLPSGQAHVTITDTDSKTLYDKQLPISSVGTVEGSFDLPADATLGDDTINISVHDQSVEDSRTFHVEEYRKPEYQVRVSVAKPHVLRGDSNNATIEARYFFGEPVSGAKVKYRVFESQHYWWGDPDDADDNAPGLSTSVGAGENSDDTSNEDSGYAGDQNSEQTGKLDANGKLTVPIPTRFKPDDHNDYDMVVEGAVTDPAGREITGRYRFLATYGSFRIHVEPLSYTVNKGDTAQFRVTAVDYENKPVQTPVHLHVFQRKWNSGSPPTDTTVADGDGATDATGAATVSVPINIAGSLLIVASANTPEQRQVQDQTWLWVNGGSVDFNSYSNGHTLTLIADKKSYAPGDTAHLTLISQVSGFHALVMSSGYTQEFRKVLTATGTTLGFDVPITHDSQPNVIVEAVFVQGDTVYHATKSLKVPPVQQQLQISVTPAESTFQPGQAAIYDVNTHDWQGRPVPADLSFGVVDEAIYSLYPDISGDIVRALYPKRENTAEIEDSLSYYFTGEAGTRSPLLAERKSRYRPLLAQVKPGNDVVQPRVRKAFPDTAFWQPDVHTDSSGHARVSLNFPDSLTTWRATVRAITTDSKAGSMINRVLVRKNVIVRLGQPRFLRKGDTVTVPLIVHNYLPDTKQVQVSLTASGVDIISGSPQQITVPSRGEAAVLYHLRASSIGTATLTAKALSTQESDALEITLPVHPSGVAETEAASGVMVNNADGTRQINFPGNTDPAAHSLQVQISPSIAGSVFSALDYLTSFPYGCTEQTMSSFLPNIIVSQTMQQLHLPSHTPQATLNAEIDAGLTRLQDYHHSDGGWGWWKEDQSQVFMTAYVVSGLAQAVKAGYPRAQEVSQSGVDFLRRELDQHPRMKPELRAYVVYALAESGGVDAKQLDTLYSRRKDLSPQALAYTGLAMLDAHDGRAGELAQMLETQARTESEFASWTSSRNELLDIDYDGSAETTAFVLKFLTHADPNSPLLTRAAQWLVANRSQGYWWSSTQQTAFVVYGLTDYLAVSHELNADLDVEVFLNGASAGRRHFSRGDVLQGAALTVQMDAAHLQPQGNAVRVVTRGTGRAYWSMQAGYFSTAKSSYQRGSMSLNVARDYFVLAPEQKDNHIVYRLQPLNGPVQQGDVLAVHIGVTGSPLKYLMLEDPIPAGAEFVQQNEMDSYNIVQRPSNWDWWYTRQEFHDDRAAIFSTYFEGRHDSFYLLKVTNPGSFAISPARVRPMYQPGVQATTDELHLDVKETTP